MSDWEVSWNFGYEAARESWDEEVAKLEARIEKLETENQRLRGILTEALTRMDRARNILKAPNANWGMLDTSDLKRKALEES